MTATPGRASRVAWAGAQREVLAGDLRATIALAELQGLEHLYALGPLEGLTGEITVFDGTPSIARVREGQVVVDKDGAARACFLVYADVASWRWTTLRSLLADGDVGSRVVQVAAERGVPDGIAPIAFTLRGVASNLTFHVLDKRDGLPHSPERHEEAQVRFTVHDREVEVIGFHSAAHRGIFTPSDSSVHMHFRTSDGRLSGHVERLQLTPDSLLGLPAIERPG